MPSQHHPVPAPITAAVHYAHPNASLSVDLTQPGPLGENLVDRIERQNVMLQDARQLSTPNTFERNGVELIRPQWQFDEFLKDNQVQADLYPQVLEYLQSKVEFSHGIVFDHTIRSKNLETLSTSNRAPITTVHCDYTPESAAIKAHKEFGELAKDYRLQFVNIWLPIFNPVNNYPLVFLAQDSFEDKHLKNLSVHYPDRVGSIRVAQHAPEHNWFYYPEMTTDEALLFRTFDSHPVTGQAQSLPHTSVDNIWLEEAEIASSTTGLPQKGADQQSPTTDLNNTASRTSIELRALLLIEPD